MCEWQSVKHEACGHETKIPVYCVKAPIVSKIFMLSGVMPFSAWGLQTCSGWELHRSIGNEAGPVPPENGGCPACRHWTESAEADPQIYAAACCEAKEV